MKRRSCRDFDEARSAYVDGHLDARERQELLRHLSDCADCRQEVAELQRLRTLLTDTGRDTPIPHELPGRLAAIGSSGSYPPTDIEGEPHDHRRAGAMSAAGITIVLTLIAGVGYFAAPNERAGVGDPSAAVRADFSATLAQLPMAGAGVAAALMVEPKALRTSDIEVPSDPTMAGTTLSSARIADLLQRADVAADQVRYIGVQQVVAPRDDLTTAAQVEIDTAPGEGSQVIVRNLAGDEVAEGLVPARAQSRISESDLLDALAGRYSLSGLSGGTLLGRPVTLIEARRHGGAPSDVPAARWWLDDQTGLVLRQQTFDHAGRLVLSADFTELRIGGSVGTDLFAGNRQLLTTMSQQLTTAAFTTSSAGRLSSQGWFCHSELAGMSLVRLRADAPAVPGVLHMLYTDGLSTVSVFERRGRLAHPPAGAQWDPNLGAYRSDAMLNTATWQSGSAVFTVATNGSPALRDKVVAALPRAAADDQPHGRPSARTTMNRIWAGWTRIFELLS